MPMPDARRCPCCRRVSLGPWWRAAFDGGPETVVCGPCGQHLDLAPDGRAAFAAPCPHATLRLLTPDAR